MRLELTHNNLLRVAPLPIGVRGCKICRKAIPEIGFEPI